jgi:hypothetical protein
MNVVDITGFQRRRRARLKGKAPAEAGEHIQKAKAPEKKKAAKQAEQGPKEGGEGDPTGKGKDKTGNVLD